MNKWALITGASSGIGAALARVYAEERHNVILVARRKQKLQALAEELRELHAEVHVIPMDLSLKKSARELFKAVQQLGVHVDVLVNNAGFTYLGRFVDMDLAAAEDMMQLNLGTLVSLTHLFARPMIEAGEGKILNLSSTTAFQPFPGHALYAAGKALILSFSEALHEELKGTGVTCTVLCPGPTESEMIDAVQAESNLKAPSFMVADVMSVAKEGFNATNRGDALCVPGLSNKFSTMMVSYPPRWLVRTMFGYMGRMMIKKP